MKYILFGLGLIFSIGGLANSFIGVIEKDYGRQALGLIELIIWSSIAIWNWLEIKEG